MVWSISVRTFLVFFIFLDASCKESEKKENVLMHQQDEGKSKILPSFGGSRVRKKHSSFQETQIKPKNQKVIEVLDECSAAHESEVESSPFETENSLTRQDEALADSSGLVLKLRLVEKRRFFVCIKVFQITQTDPDLPIGDTDDFMNQSAIEAKVEFCQEGWIRVQSVLSFWLFQEEALGLTALSVSDFYEPGFIWDLLSPFLSYLMSQSVVEPKNEGWIQGQLGLKFWVDRPSPFLQSEATELAQKKMIKSRIRMPRKSRSVIYLKTKIADTVECEKGFKDLNLHCFGKLVQFMGGLLKGCFCLPCEQKDDPS